MALPASMAFGGAALAQSGPAQASMRAQARTLSMRPFQPPPRALPPELSDIDYDAYRDLRFRPEKALWAGGGLPFQLQMFHRGGRFRERIDLFEAADGQVRPIAYDPDQFTFGRVRRPAPDPTLGFAGFRIHAPINTPGRYDEVAVFLGASYFRAVAKGEVYGLSARGLAIGAGEADEEFPLFRSFIVERPAAGASSIVVHALLDSVSVAGAYRFTITPGAITRFDVEASLFPRTLLTRAGLAPLTSMYLFGAEQPRRFDDFRPEVHDSDGLAMQTGRGERLWRPLANPAQVQTSAFQDDGPRGFGLMQRQRAFAAYQDLEANYHQRPSLWVEPLEGFTRGDVRLVEMPAAGEEQDNIAASWRPAHALAARREHRFRYRLNWAAAPSDGVVQAVAWRTGKIAGSRRLFVVDFAPGAPDKIDTLSAHVRASAGGVSQIVVQANPSTGGARVSFEFDPQGASVSELRCALASGAGTTSETWIHRWLS